MYNVMRSSNTLKVLTEFILEGWRNGDAFQTLLDFTIGSVFRVRMQYMDVKFSYQGT